MFETKPKKKIDKGKMALRLDVIRSTEPNLAGGWALTAGGRQTNSVPCINSYLLCHRHSRMETNYETKGLLPYTMRPGQHLYCAIQRRVVTNTPPTLRSNLWPARTLYDFWLIHNHNIGSYPRSTHSKFCALHPKIQAWDYRPGFCDLLTLRFSVR